jgi:lysyl-tRNA synthetase class 2
LGNDAIPRDCDQQEIMDEPLVQVRVEKTRQLKERGIDPYPARCIRTHCIGDVITQWESLRAGEEGDRQVTIVGRLLAVRHMGRAMFFNLRDGSGQIQGYATVDVLGDEHYQMFCKNDVGDFLQVTGVPFRTKRGELSIALRNFVLLAKSLRPLPEKWHGLKDVELRHRHRSVDLIASPKVRDTFIRRSKMISAIRYFLDARGFLEVETPVMQPIPGGATARPFVTHHNVLDVDLYLRIAVELYLKRLIIGGLEKVYELGKDFRNEGVSTEHNPEFTMLEIYEAYSDYEGMMRLVEELIRDVAEKIVGTMALTYQGNKIDLEAPWTRVTMEEVVEQTTGVSIASASEEDIRSQAVARKIDLPTGSRGRLIEYLFETQVEKRLIEPTIVRDYPVDISPLAKRKAGSKNLVERFELFIGGVEVANAFTELNDPLEQRARLEEQEKLREKGDEEAQRIDEDFLFALEHGMPPTGGIGIGIDRLAMLLTDTDSIRDVILFPALRKKES